MSLAAVSDPLDHTLFYCKCDEDVSPRGSLLGIPAFPLSLPPNPYALSLPAARLTDPLWPAAPGQLDPRAGPAGLGPGFPPIPAPAAAVAACEAMMSISSKSSWVNSSSSPNGSSKASAATASWFRPRCRLVGGQFMLRERKQAEM